MSDLRDSPSHVCPLCSKRFSRKDNLKRHISALHKDPKSVDHYKCELCNYATTRRDNLNRRVQDYHRQPYPTPTSIKQSDEGTSSKRRRLSQESTGDGEKSGDDDDSIAKLVKENWRWIQTGKRISNRKLEDRFNFQTENPTWTDIEQHIREIYREQSHSFKVNAACGFILKNTITDQLTFYYASHNTRLFKKPPLIHSDADIESVVSDLAAIDLLEHCRQQRPNTKTVVVSITNILYYVDKVIPFTLGGGSVALPTFIRNRKCIITLNRNTHGALFPDNYCLFRCLVYHRAGKIPVNEREVCNLVRQFCVVSGKSPASFEGVSLPDEIPMSEDEFETNVELFKLTLQQMSADDEDVAVADTPEQVVCEKVYTSRKRHSTTMNLNLFQNHTSYIQNLHQYSRCWRCKKCSQLFYRHYIHVNHERKCLGQTRFVFPGGGYGSKKTVFDHLAELDIVVPKELRYYPFRVCFDYECISVPIDDLAAGNKEQLTREHIPASVSLISNIPNYEEPVCFISDGDPDKLIQRMYDTIVEMSAAAREIVNLQLEEYSLELEMLANEYDRLREEEEDKEEENSTLEESEEEGSAYKFKKYKWLHTSLNKWMEQLPVLGFYSGRYDVNVIRRYLFPYLIKIDDEPEYIIKRTNDYLCFATSRTVFLDVKNFVAAGTSYAKWLRSYDVKEEKGTFCFEWFTSLSKLNEPTLPPKSAFWSELKQAGISDEEYQKLEHIWVEEGFTTMREFLTWYNNKDVIGFREAAEKMFVFWKSLEIDCFKGHISLPGLALSVMTKFMDRHTILPLFDNSMQHIYDMLRKNIVGGLSVVMHRFHEVDVTRLPNGSTVKWISSYDCNSLYLWALAQPTGTGVFEVWEQIPRTNVTGESTIWYHGQMSDTDRTQRLGKWRELRTRNLERLFRRNRVYKYSKPELEWLEWSSLVLGRQIDHKFNGRQKVVYVSKKLNYRLDGFDPQTRTAYQFHGCLWHGHGCTLDTERDNDKRTQRRVETRNTTTNLQNAGYVVVEMWECQWSEEKQANSNVKAFIKEYLQLPRAPIELSAEGLIRRICSGELFGLIECDIEVPWWNDALIKHFEPFPPIFKNCEITINDIGEYMREYAEEHGYMKKPTKCLIGSYWGQKILLATPLLEWYISHGLVVTRIYRIIEMIPRACFAKLKDLIVFHRRRADDDPAYASVGEMWKTVGEHKANFAAMLFRKSNTSSSVFCFIAGNSCYGKPMTAKERHKDTIIVSDVEAPHHINSNRFSKLEEVGDDAYEICLDKKKIHQDLPLTVSFFVLAYAKLKMLDFVYDFLFEFLEPGSFQLICSDTDSIWAAYSAKSIDELIREEKREEYLRDAKQRYLVTDRHSLRTPGVFKVEYSSDGGVIALCSKTYLCWNGDGSTKRAHKGLSKITNNFTRQDYERTLLGRKKGVGENHGIKVVGDRMMQYRQQREGLSFLYCKREVMEDGVTTKALPL